MSLLLAESSFVDSQGWGSTWPVAPVTVMVVGRVCPVPVGEAADHVCWRVKESYFLALVPHSSLAAVWAEIPFFSTSGFFRRNNTRELQENKRASQKAFQGYEMFLLVESLGPGCPGLCWIGANLRQHPVGHPKAPVGLYLFGSLPPIFLSSCGVPLSSWVGEGEV